MNNEYLFCVEFIFCIEMQILFVHRVLIKVGLVYSLALSKLYNPLHPPAERIMLLCNLTWTEIWERVKYRCKDRIYYWIYFKEHNFKNAKDMKEEEKFEK